MATSSSIAAVLSLLFLLLRCTVAQPSPPSSNDSSNSSSDGYYSYRNFNPAMAVSVVIMISAFFFLCLFSIYIRKCSGGGDEFSLSLRRRGGNNPGRSRRQRGLRPEVIEAFPTMVYAEVKEMKLGKGALECAVCICEFDDDEELRLLPHCSHVFHPECIDAWLASHLTCPICRANLAEKPDAAGDLDDPPATAASDSDTGVPTQDHVAILVDRTVLSAEIEKEREEAALELARIGSQRRAARSRTGQQPAKFPRSHSTGHSVLRPAEDVDRYTLRLPEHVRSQIDAARRFHRSTSCVAYPTAGEGISRHGHRGWGGGNEGSSSGWRSFRLRKSDRWPSFFRSLSVKVPAWAAGRRGEGVGSVKKSEGDFSARAKTTL